MMGSKLRQLVLTFGQKWLLWPIAVVGIVAMVLVYGSVSAAPGVDQIANQMWWQVKVQQQTAETANHQYAACLFGDSISSALGKSLGEEVYNFAIGGLSSVSLVQQLEHLNQSTVQCQTAIVAIGTNDAMYSIADENFISNMKQVIAHIRSLGANQMTLLPAFYSTLSASRNPAQAGTLERVDEISQLIRQVADSEQIEIANELLEPLYRDRSLRADLTFDGVHLNHRGKQIYRQLLLDLLNSKTN